MPENVTSSSGLLDLFRSEFRKRSLRDLLRESPKALLGVTDAAEESLKKLDIASIFDLATSGVFDAAKTLVVAATDPHNVLSQHGTATADLIRGDIAGNEPINELQMLPLELLEAIPTGDVVDIQNGLDVETVRDLALYPPYLAAKRVLDAVYFPENAPTYDPESPSDLLPRTGEYPTERVQYTTLLMDEIHVGDGDGSTAEVLTNVASPQFAPLDLGELAKADAGFKKVAYGALLTFTQSWYAQGVTLGQLLHSTSLGAGESTRIAMIHWSSQRRAGETEAIDEVDQLSNDTSQNRAINEVTQAVAAEAQGGFSHAETNSKSSEWGVSVAGEWSAPLGGLLGGPSGSMGATSSGATSSATADSYSSSWGRRELGSEMSQAIADRTHQQAHSSRSRRASVVKEVSQSENEAVSTRVLANYNHMHALTIQYYEVVQVHRVEVALSRADKVIFIPVKLADFNDDAIVRRFQSVLARAALTYPIREALLNLDVIALTPATEVRFTGLGSRLDIFLKQPPTLMQRAAPESSGNLQANLADSAKVRDAVANAATMVVGETDTTKSTEALVNRIATKTTELLRSAPATRSTRTARAIPPKQQANEKLWTAEQVMRLSGLLNRALLRAGSNAIYLPTDVTIEGVTVAADGVAMTVTFHTSAGAAVTDVGPDNPLALAEVARITLTGSSPAREVSATLTLTLNRSGVRFPLELPAVSVDQNAAGETRVVDVKPGGVNANLKQHLSDNRMYYSQALLRSLDGTQIALLLSGFGVDVGGRLVPVSQVVDPRPVRYVGNYMAFTMGIDPRDDRKWREWLDDHDIVIGSTKQDVVPLPSGGTFAEAVLGRSNCAEKLDITRFWNWQDSPIPLQPTEIAAIQTGSRATSEDTSPGQLSTPIINITSPAALPDPTGTAGVLAAIQNGSMFRDMSGLQASIGLAQSALQATAAGASTAGQQAGTNMDNLLKANTERQRIAADMVKSLADSAVAAYTGGAAGGMDTKGGPGASNHSQDGAKINYFDKTQDTMPAADGAANDSTPAGSSAGGTSTPTGNGGSRVSKTKDAGYSKNPAALAATWGDAEPRSAVVNKVVDAAAETISFDPEEITVAVGSGGVSVNLLVERWDRRVADEQEGFALLETSLAKPHELARELKGLVDNPIAGASVASIASDAYFKPGFPIGVLATAVLGSMLEAVIAGTADEVVRVRMPLYESYADGVALALDPTYREYIRANEPDHVRHAFRELGKSQVAALSPTLRYQLAYALVDRERRGDAGEPIEGTLDYFRQHWGGPAFRGGVIAEIRRPRNKPTHYYRVD